MCYHFSIQNDEEAISDQEKTAMRSKAVSVLAMLGGVDSRLRLGGPANHPDLNKVYITSILPKGKLRVLSVESHQMKVCKLHDLEGVSELI